MGYPIKNGNTTRPLEFLLVQSSDHLTGLTGASPTVTISKNGGSFASPAGSVTEVGNGWYKVAANATDAGTSGPLLLHASATGSDPTDDRFEVVGYDPDDGTHLGLTAIPNAAAGGASGLPTVDSSNNIHGLQPGAIDHAQFSNAVLATLLRSYFVTTGTTTPATADMWCVGGLYNGLVYWKSFTTNLFCWYNGSSWIISAVLGTAGSAYYTSGTNNSNGPYTAAGTASGTPTITPHGNSILAAYQPEQTWMALTDGNRYLKSDAAYIAGQTPTMTNVNGEPLLDVNCMGFRGNVFGQLGSYPLVNVALSGNVSSATSTTIVVPSGTGTSDSIKGMTVTVGGGSGSIPVQTRTITGYNDGTKTITVDTPWIVTPTGAGFWVQLNREAALDSSLQVATNGVNGNMTGNVDGSVGSIAGITFPAYFGNMLIEAGGWVKSDLFAILGTGMTESGPGWTTAAIKKFFNVATPTSTMNEITLVDTATTLTNAPPANTTETAIYNKLPANNIADETLVIAATNSILTAVGSPTQTGVTVNANVIQINGATAGGDPYPIVNSGSYGNAQLLAAIQNVQNNTFIASSIPQELALPTSGSVTLQIVTTWYNADGAAENLDASANPTITLLNDAGTDRSSRLGSWSNPATGIYQINYTSSSTDALEGLHWNISGTINSKLRRLVAYTQLVPTYTSTFNSSDRTMLTNIANVSPTYPPLVDSSGGVTLSAKTHTGATVPTVTTVVTTTNLTNAPANGDLTPAMKASITAAVPTAVQNRQEMDNNSAQLAAMATASALATDTAAILTAVGVPLQAASYIAPSTPVQLAAAQTAIINAVDSLPQATITNYITVPAAVAAASQDPTVIVCLRGDTLRSSLPLMGSLANRTKLVITVKANINDADDQAAFQVVEGIGLTRLNGNGTVTAGTANLVVADPTTGTVNLEVDASVTSMLAICDLVWDVQVYFADGITTPIGGVMSVVADVTQAVT